MEGAAVNPGPHTEPLPPDPDATAPALPRAAKTQEALGGHAARGVSFMMAQSLATRVFALVCQMALAYLLVPEHFGLIALADTIASFANMLQLIGVREVLVARHRRFRIYGNAGFWITLSTGLATAAIVAGAAPIAASVYGAPDLIGIMLVLALAQPFYALCTVPEAKLQSELRFKRLAGIIGVWAVLMPALQVAFALMNFGAYSFVLARLIAGIVRLAMAMSGSKLHLRARPQIRRWKFIVSSSALIFATSVLVQLASMGDRPLLGIFVDEHQVGLYAFAYALSLQTIMLIANSLDGVLFATMAKLNDEPKRQLHAFLRASRALAMVVVPMCIIQAAVSDAAVHTVFPYDKWKDAIPAMQILGVGMLFLGAFSPASSLLSAQQRFRTRFFMSVAHTLVYGVTVIGGVILGRKYLPAGSGGVTGAAAGVAIAMAAMYPLWAYVAIKKLGGHAHEALRIIARPLAASLLATAIGLLAGEAARRGVIAAGHPRFEHWARLFITGSVSLAAYVPLARVLMPREFTEIAVKILAMGRRFSPAVASRTAALLRIEVANPTP